MTDQGLQFPKFYVTAPSPCPYLDGKVERKVFTELKGPDAAALNEALGRVGFRRSQSVVYRPACEAARNVFPLGSGSRTSAPRAPCAGSRKPTQTSRPKCARPW